MFKNTYQSGLLSIFYSCGSDPLGIWDTEVKNGHIKRITDKEVNSLVLEIVGTNVSTTYISCPKGKDVLGIQLPFLVMIVKNLRKYFTFEITILDDRNMRRRFRISNFQSTTKIKPFCTTMPIGLSAGWNQIQFNLADFTRRAYGSQFIEALRVQIHANARLRRIYFCDRLYLEEELPQEYKLFVPLTKAEKKPREVKKEETKPTNVSQPKDVIKEVISEPEPGMVSPITTTDVGEEIQEDVKVEKAPEDTMADEAQGEFEGEGHGEELGFEEATEVVGEFEELPGEELPGEELPGEELPGEDFAEGVVTEFEGPDTSEPTGVQITEVYDDETTELENLEITGTPTENESVKAENPESV